jgi:AraC-like DNA-binding protein
MELVRMIVLLEAARRLREGVHRLDPRSTGDKPDPRVLRARQFIKAHVWDDISLGDVARHAGTSVPTLARCFKAATGGVERTRFHRAGARWPARRKSIKEFAEALGFYDAFICPRPSNNSRAPPPISSRHGPCQPPTACT